jgi:CubicO group peptidase (beta-lactamase class C family)
MPNYHLERVKARAEALVKANEYSSIEWHMEQGGKTLEQGRTGLADALTGAPLPINPIYRIYSMTKPLVAAVGVMLIDEGKLRLSDPVARFLPKFASLNVLQADGTLRPANTTLRVEHLFTHRSGLSYQWQQNSVAQRYREGLKFADASVSLSELVDGLAEMPLLADPGTQWNYSFSNDVLGQVIALIEGKPLRQVLAERLFKPLNMVDTGFSVPETERSRILAMFADAAPTPGQASLVVAEPAQLNYAPPHMLYPVDNPTFERGGHGLFSTTADYAKAARFLISGLDANGQRMLSKAGVEALWTNRLPESQLPIRIGTLPNHLGYGYGLGGRVMVKPNESLFYATLGECGWSGAAMTYFWLDPQRDITGLVMSQYLGPKLPLGEDIRDAFYQSLL